MISPKKYEVDIIVVGACNMDLISYVSRFPKPGESLRGHRFATDFGGKGANQCVMAGRLGARTAMVGKVGDDSYGRDTIKNFQDNGVITDFLAVTAEALTGVAPATVVDNGRSLAVFVNGANSLITLAELERALSELDSAKIMLCQMEIEQDITLAALKAARSQGVTTVFNAAPAAAHLPDDFYLFSDIFCANEIEAETLTGMTVSNVEDAKRACRAFLDKGCKTAVITLGGDGCVYATTEQPAPVHIPVQKVTAVDTTGAGDAFLGSLAFYLALYPSMSLAESLRRCSHVASISVQSPGTQASYPWRKDLPAHLF